MTVTPNDLIIAILVILLFVALLELGRRVR